jgi:hypothetical protein
VLTGTTPHPSSRDDSPSATPAGTGDLHRRLARWLAGVALAPCHPVAHDGSCGDRLACVRCGQANAPYLTSELLSNGDLLFHCHGERVHLSSLSGLRWIQTW